MVLGAVAAVVLGALAVVGIVVAGAWMAAYRPASADALAMEGRLVALTAEPVPVATLRPQEDWDIVCRLDPYSTPAAFLPRYLGEPLPGYRYLPSDLWIDENWNGLAFIHRASRTVHVLALPNKKIYYLDGERCVGRAAGKVAHVNVQGTTVPFSQVVFSD